MRTTLAIDDEVFNNVRAYARRERISIGEALLRLARQGIHASQAAPVPMARPKSRFALLPARPEVITSEHLRRLMEQEGIRVSLRRLPDVDVWVALLDEAHVFHTQALDFIQRKRLKIAICALVENGVVRVVNLPRYSRLGPVGFAPVADKLAEICASLEHESWPCEVSLREAGLVNWPRVMGHDQITDVYLLALAVARGGCLVTLDHGVAITTVPGAVARHLDHLQRGGHRASPAPWSSRDATFSSACTSASTRIGLVT